ncbi:polyketide antibiotic transporter [Desertihabitans brevis]|uniref:Polyketide antibiotic transporter n=1 Tax=Desertihabitans brevis TaxID=2268447 RepID=A0A367YUU6_9ACTN|nr:polyketide antibiotic transporter [Desertihabitans brevis]RCK69527.1 polyketide antibiotic transporter [Desertihabitans brevis]
MRTGTGRALRLLVGHRLRRDRWTLLTWVLCFAFLWGGVAALLGQALDAQARRELVALAVTNPGVLFVRGAPQGDGLGSVMMFSVSSFTGVMAGVLGTTTAVRHTRAEEEAGRSELVGGTPVGRRLPALATAVVGVLATLAAGTALALSGLLAGLDPVGTVVAGAGVWGVGSVFTGVGLLAAQALPTARGAGTAAATVVGVAYLLRGLGDAAGTPSDDLLRVDSAWPSLLSPLGWVQQVHGFGEPRPALLLGYPLLTLLLVGVAVTVEGRRQLGTSVVAPGRGPASAASGLGSPLGLVVRTLRGTTLVWLLLGASLGAVAGLLGPRLAAGLAENPQLAALLERLGAAGHGGSMVDTFLVAVLGFVTLLACLQAMQSVIRLRAEELAVGELALTTHPPRSAWFWSHVGFGLVTGCLVVLVAAGTTAATLALDPGAGTAVRMRTVLAVAAADLPLVVVYLAVGAVLVGLLPTTTGWLGWVLLFGLMLVGQFAPLFGPVDWLRLVSPFHHVANPLADDPRWWPSVVMVAVAVAAVLAARAGWCRRDLVR